MSTVFIVGKGYRRRDVGIKEFFRFVEEKEASLNTSLVLPRTADDCGIPYQSTFHQDPPRDL